MTNAWLAAILLAGAAAAVPARSQNHKDISELTPAEIAEKKAVDHEEARIMSLMAQRREKIRAIKGDSRKSAAQKRSETRGVRDEYSEKVNAIVRKRLDRQARKGPRK